MVRALFIWSVKVVREWRVPRVQKISFAEALRLAYLASSHDNLLALVAFLTGQLRSSSGAVVATVRRTLMAR